MTEKFTTPAQPRWQDLLARYLSEQQQLPELPMSEVELYQAQPALGLDVALAWPDALLPASTLSESESWKKSELPAEWALQARNVAWSAPFPCCVGLAPQFLQRISLLLQNTSEFFRTPLRLTAQTTLPGSSTSSLMGQIASARIAVDSEQVKKLLGSLSVPVDEMLKQNEQGAQDWLQGNHDEAGKRWEKLPADQPVVAFNQALACLQKSDHASGQKLLAKAAKGFASSSGWHHLAELYLTALKANS